MTQRNARKRKIQRTIRITVILLAFVGALLSLPACNTVAGMGEDVSAAGQSLADMASSANPSK